MRGAAGDSGELEAAFEDAADIAASILADQWVPFDFLLLTLNLRSKAKAVQMAAATSHQWHEALVLVAFAAESVLGDAVGREPAVDREAVRVVGFLVAGGVVDLDDLETLQAGAVEGGRDAIPQLAAGLDRSASRTAAAAAAVVVVSVVLMLVLLMKQLLLSGAAVGVGREGRSSRYTIGVAVVVNKSLRLVILLIILLVILLMI